MSENDRTTDGTAGSDRVQTEFRPGELETVSEHDMTTDDGMSGGEAARGRFRRLLF